MGDGFRSGSGQSDGDERRKDWELLSQSRRGYRSQRWQAVGGRREEEVGDGDETRVRRCSLSLSLRRRIEGGGDRAGLSLVMCVCVSGGARW